MDIASSDMRRNYELATQRNEATFASLGHSLGLLRRDGQPYLNR